MSLQETAPVGQAVEQSNTVDYAHLEAVKTIEKALAIIDERWRYLGENVSSPPDARNYFKLQLGTEKEEVFCVLFLTSKHQVIKFEKLFQGTIDSASVHPRVVARRALELNAAAMIIGHNHPSGDPEPSQADITITETLLVSMSLLNIKLLDHLIIGQGDPVSLAERGHISGC